MRSLHETTRIRLALVAVLLAPAILVTLAWAQAPSTPSPVVSPPPASAPAPGETGGGLAVLIMTMVALLAVLVLAVKIFDLKRKREEEAVALQARLSDALFIDPALAGLPITPTARLPLWRGSPAVVDVAGQTPTQELREAALRLVERELSGSRSDFQIEDRIMVDPLMARHAA
jgi:hypothetical protein